MAEGYPHEAQAVERNVSHQGRVLFGTVWEVEQLTLLLLVERTPVATTADRVRLGAVGRWRVRNWTIFDDPSRDDHEERRPASCRSCACSECRPLSHAPNNPYSLQRLVMVGTLIPRPIHRSLLSPSNPSRKRPQGPSFYKLMVTALFAHRRFLTTTTPPLFG